MLHKVGRVAGQKRGSHPESFDYLVGARQVEQASIDAARVREMEAQDAGGYRHRQGARVPTGRASIGVLEAGH